MTKDPKILENGAGGGGITRREFTNRAAALGATTALATTMSGLLPSEAVAATPKKGGHLRVGMAQGGPTDSLDPSTGAGEFIRMMRYSTMNQLVEVDHTGAAKPELAESWEPGSSAATWIFNLRKGVTWHDGKSLDANDVVGTLDTHRGTKSRSQIRSILKSVKDVRADTKHRVIFELKERNVNFPFLMAAFQVRSIKDDKMYDFQNGTGTYVLKEFEPGIRVALERNPNKWQEDRGWFDSAEMTPILDGGARNNALVTGEVDVIHRPDRRTWKRLQAIKGLNVTYRARTAGAAISTPSPGSHTALIGPAPRAKPCQPSKRTKRVGVCATSRPRLAMSSFTITRRHDCGYRLLPIHGLVRRGRHRSLALRCGYVNDTKTCVSGSRRFDHRARHAGDDAAPHP